MYPKSDSLSWSGGTITLDSETGVVKERLVSSMKSPCSGTELPGREGLSNNAVGSFLLILWMLLCGYVT